MSSEEREEYWKILMGLLTVLVLFSALLVDCSRLRLAISTMLMSLLAHLAWARRIIRGGGCCFFCCWLAVVVVESFVVVGSDGENFEMMVVAFGEIWVLDWIERWVIEWVDERVVASKGILFLGLGVWVR